MEDWLDEAITDLSYRFEEETDAYSQISAHYILAHDCLYLPDAHA